MVTKDDFLKYYKAQRSGKYNMFMESSKVIIKYNIPYDIYWDIIKNYDKYYNEYIQMK